MKNGNLEEDLANAVQDLYGEPTIYESEEEWLQKQSLFTSASSHALDARPWLDQAEWATITRRYCKEQGKRERTK